LQLYVKIETIIEIDGTMEQAREIRDRVTDAAMDSVEDLIHCGDPECCTEPKRPDQIVGGSYSSSTITDHLDEED
jgi:hypothetical protein